MIIPAILESNFDEVEKKIKLVEGVASKMQIDVVDNTIVNGKTFLDIYKLNSLNSKSDLSIHLMVKDPIRYFKKSKFFFPSVRKKIECVSTIITQLIEEESLRRFIDLSKSIGYKIGLSINADEDISLLQPFINEVDLIQFMGVIPGRQGNDLIPSVLNKISEFKTTFPGVMTQIDGGANMYTLPQILETGVDNIVVGSAIFSSEDPKDKYLEFSSLFEEKRRTAHGSSI